MLNEEIEGTVGVVFQVVTRADGVFVERVFDEENAVVIKEL